QTPAAADSAAATPPPVRTRWTPKPEQILILESIFNSGMVNPPKDETVRIRKLLEKFGPVGDANVFYWFQNRRSRSRRRQRQLQAAATSASVGGGGAGFSQELMAADCYYPATFWGSSSSSGIQGNINISDTNNNNNNNNSDLINFPASVLEQSPKFFYEDSSCLQFRQPVITVFINGMSMDVSGGPMDVKAAFGGDFVVVHSSGTAVPINEYGFLLEGLKPGENYFLV
ncbi:hypothetical protein M569_04635, partial [Genlisea aurea]